MSFGTLNDLNWIAVLVATIVYFAIGGFWYSNAGFGKVWIRASGNTPPEGAPGAKYMIGPVVTSLVASIATAMLARATGSTTLGHGIVLGIVVAVGFAGTITALGALFDQKPEPRTWFVINYGYHLVALVIVGVLVSVWD